MNLPEITEVQRFQYHPGDRFILRLKEHYALEQQQIDDIKVRFLAALQLPEETPVVVLDSSWDLTIAGPAGMDGCLWCLDHFDEGEACVCSRNCGDAQCRTARS